MFKPFENYMLHALELATDGWGWVNPNPMVGAVVVKDGKVVGQGCHKKVGTSHAEVVAIKEAGKMAKGADLVVTLEPCSHFGRTPPCTDLIIKSGIRRVIYGMKDPNPIVNGRGLKILKKAGIEVVGPILEKECRSLNRIYTHWITKKLPFVILKVALSLDGKIAGKNGKTEKITNGKCRRRMHYWRGGVDAVLVGAETIRMDDPLLNVRAIKGLKQPRPVILTTGKKIDKKSKVFARKEKPLIFSGKRFQFKEVLKKLAAENITSVIVEGGADIHEQLLKNKLAGYAIIGMSPKLIGKNGKGWVKKFPEINPDQILVFGNNLVIEGTIDYVHRNNRRHRDD